MGYLQDLTIAKDSVTCSSLSCSNMCHHAIWILHTVFNIQKSEPLIFNKRFTANEWDRILQSFPPEVPLVQLPTSKEQCYVVNRRNSTKQARCATCKAPLYFGDVQVTTDGPYRTIMRHWITRTFFFCPKLSCITTMPRNSFIRPFCLSNMTLRFNLQVTPEETQSLRA